MTINNTLNQRDFVNVPVTGLVVSLSDYLPSKSRWRHALIGVSGGPIRWLAISDQSPTATHGAYIGPGGQIEWLNPDIDYSGMIYNTKFVKAGANDANLEVSLFW